ncbi:alanine--tRNA ligase [Oesophagostomum dentatum]|uniref:Alanine--tRNA ligase n=1 Tax=Oesophagostomum dentatum TaxID=61180 RepID=A0A0B1T1R4_OESDE|nr:alanine--tRNA ligase [Oesophagostomum dentatum]
MMLSYRRLSVAVDLIVTLKVSKRGAYEGRVGSEDVDGRDASYRILADHMRAVVIAVADGVEPSAVDAGFIVRKMLRRSFWHATKHLGIDRFACSEFVPTVIETLERAYPELSTTVERVQKCVDDEERHYWEIFDKGRELFEQMRLSLPKGSTAFSGDDAFLLHDTHGIPIEITEDLSKEHGLSIDKDRFLELQEDAKNLSRSTSGFKKSVTLDTTGLEGCSDKAKYSYSLRKDGLYEFPAVSSEIFAVFRDNKRVESLDLNSHGSVILKECQFYAEEGGQKYDKGFLELEGETVFKVESVEKVNGLSVLHGKATGNVVKGSMIKQKIDVKRRVALMRAHTATHLLNWALRRVGAGRGQRGSSIDEDSLRFDYATDDCAGEDDTGKEYPAVVRVARIGDNLDDACAVECCSGTHVLNTSSIMDFTVLSDRSSAKGVRRIFALTGEKAKKSREYGREIISRLEFIAEDSSNDSLNEVGIEDFVYNQNCDTENVQEIDWSQMPYEDNAEARKLLKVIKKKRKMKKEIKC